MGNAYTSGLAGIPAQVRRRVNALTDKDLTNLLIEARIGLRQVEKCGMFPMGFNNERIWRLLDELFPWKNFD